MFLDCDLNQHCGWRHSCGIFVGFIPANPGSNGAGQSRHGSVTVTLMSLRSTKGLQKNLSSIFLLI